MCVCACVDVVKCLKDGQCSGICVCVLGNLVYRCPPRMVLIFELNVIILRRLYNVNISARQMAALQGSYFQCNFSLEFLDDV